MISPDRGHVECRRRWLRCSRSGLQVAVPRRVAWNDDPAPARRRLRRPDEPIAGERSDGAAVSIGGCALRKTSSDWRPDGFASPGRPSLTYRGRRPVKKRAGGVRFSRYDPIGMVFPGTVLVGQRGRVPPYGWDTGPHTLSRSVPDGPCVGPHALNCGNVRVA